MNRRLATRTRTQANRATTEGDEEDVTVDVNNIGDLEGTFTVDLEITVPDDTVVVDEEEDVVGLGSEEGTEKVTFSDVTSGLAVDDNYEMEVSTEDDSILAENTLDVEDEAGA